MLIPHEFGRQIQIRRPARRRRARCLWLISIFGRRCRRGPPPCLCCLRHLFTPSLLKAKHPCRVLRLKQAKHIIPFSIDNMINNAIVKFFLIFSHLLRLAFRPRERGRSQQTSSCIILILKKIGRIKMIRNQNDKTSPLFFPFSLIFQTAWKSPRSAEPSITPDYLWCYVF